MDEPASAAGRDLLREFGLDASLDDDDTALPPRMPGSRARPSAAAAATTAAATAGAAEDDEGGLDADGTTPVAQLTRAWLNEKGAPELLPFEQPLMERLMGQVQTTKDRVDRERAEDPASAFVANLFYMELERIKFVMRSYLKSRLVKIERFAQYIVEDDELRQRLSPDELQYAEAYVRLLERHLLASGLRELPEQLARLNAPEMKNRPRLSSYVLCRVRRSLDGFVLPSSNTSVDLAAGDVYAMRFDDVQALLQRGDVTLL